jgi:hypothetical protein
MSIGDVAEATEGQFQIVIFVAPSALDDDGREQVGLVFGPPKMKHGVQTHFHGMVISASGVLLQMAGCESMLVDNDGDDPNREIMH